MEIDRETVKTVIELLNKAFDFDDGDVFGILHNTAVDTVGALELMLEEPTQLEEVIPEFDLTPAQRRAAGQHYCPLCFTFGHSHRKGCKFAPYGTTAHIRETT